MCLLPKERNGTPAENQREKKKLTGEVEADERRGYAGLRVENRRRDLKEDLRPGVELENHAEDAVLLGAGLSDDPLGYLELHRYDSPSHAEVMIAQGEKNLRAR